MADQRDLVLSPVQYAYVQDRTDGTIRVWTGPLADTLTANAGLVVWTGKKFMEQPDVNQARLTFTTASENQYVVLTDPAENDPEAFPTAGAAAPARKLDVGKRIVIEGPASFALWPGQTAEVIDGHRLSSDEYLVAQVYQPEAAEENQERARVEPSGGEGDDVPAVVTPRRFTMGERIVIKGTDVSFYIPPTGIEVLRDPTKEDRRFVRQAAVVEQLEYICLINEKGRKRYERGPQVVFPEPDEVFYTESGERKFRAVELGPQVGIHIKVTTDYQHDGAGSVTALRGAEMVEVSPGEQLKEGDELFLTGRDTPIYYPRTEHAYIEYADSKRIHRAIAIPAGEGRYALDRIGDGGVRKIVGPRMYLPDPREEVIVRRVLELKAVELWYPGNSEALLVNQELAGVQATAGTEYLTSEQDPSIAMASIGQAGPLARSHKMTGGIAADRIRRGSGVEYSRSIQAITLNTKYDGPPRVSVYAGYAVMVMDPTGNRRVEVGPVDLLLEYHESLMALTLSTGRPKGSKPPLKTVYLRTINNAVGDMITVETRDLVPVTLELSLRVNFEGETAEERSRWFDIEDYVALLTDHVRSKVRNLAKRHDVQRFYADTADLIRDALLGESAEGKRTGLLFEENGMRLYDVEILGVTIQHPGVKQMLDQAMANSLTGAIRVSQEEESTRREARLEELERERIGAREETSEAKSIAAIHEIERGAAETLRAIGAQLQEQEESQKVLQLERAERKAAADQDLLIRRESDQVLLLRAKAEVDLFEQRAKAIDPKLADAIRIYGKEKVAAEIAQALGPYSLAVGTSAVDVLRDRLKGTALSPVLDALAEPVLANVYENGGGTAE